MRPLPSDLSIECEPSTHGNPECASIQARGLCLFLKGAGEDVSYRPEGHEMKSISKYQVIEELGTSAAGTTYKVRDSFRNREFALKLFQTIPGLSGAAKEQ